MGNHLLSGHTTQCCLCAKKRIGRNETRLLDIKAKELRVKIDRQVTFAPYVVDGYCRETNTIFEVYETYHDRKIIRDLERQHELTQQLNCNFVIIPDRSH
jgi:very-short-patch-repair endonuclease